MVSLCDVRGGGVWGCVMDASCCERTSDSRRGRTARGGGGGVVGLDDSPLERLSHINGRKNIKKNQENA